MRARINRLLTNEDVLGFIVILKDDTRDQPVRGMMMIEIEGRGTEKVIKRLSALPMVNAIHTTNGRWDVFVELGTTTLAALDSVLRQIWLIEGVVTLNSLSAKMERFWKRNCLIYRGFGFTLCLQKYLM